MNDKANELLSQLKNPWLFKLYLLRRLPSCFFWGVQIAEISFEEAVISIPFKWFTKNPFRSTYFAALSGAAELSTGLLAATAVRGAAHPISMLITGMEGRFVKKATGKTLFTCTSGKAIQQTIARAVETGEGEVIRVKTEGRNLKGELVAEFVFEWSFKRKRGKNSISS